ncbi:MAG: hypothetical protein WDN45_02825, partial [Caulobacteraceae bacterium]
MAFDDPSVPLETGRRLSVVPCRQGWAIKHGDGFLGVSASRDEALRLMQALRDEPPVSRRPL